MRNILGFVKGHFSSYTLTLFLLSAFILMFIDKSQLMRKGLKREARFAFIMGIAYAAIAIIGFLINNTLPAR